MEFKQLEIFVAVAEERSVQRAAERVFRTQPAVSMAISKLEGEVGLPLFDRTPARRFHLTHTGQVLCDYARRLLALRDEASRCWHQIIHPQEDRDGGRDGRDTAGGTPALREACGRSM